MLDIAETTVKIHVQHIPRARPDLGAQAAVYASDCQRAAGIGHAPTFHSLSDEFWGLFFLCYQK